MAAFVGGKSSCHSLRPTTFVAPPSLVGRTFATTSALQAKKALLKYDYVPDVLEKRGPYREEHIALANRFIQEGSCLSGGPVGEVGSEVPKGALFVFEDADSAEAYAKGDPYVANGIVTKYSIEEWNVVVQKE